MQRTFKIVATRFGEIKVKCCTYDGVTKIKPEYDSLSDAAAKFNVTMHDVYLEVIRLCE
jgi:hypothetical protein